MSVCVASLIAQAINLLPALSNNRPAEVAIAVVLVVETIPALLLLLLFAKDGSLTSPFQAMQSALSTKSATAHNPKNSTTGTPQLKLKKQSLQTSANE